MITGKQNFRHSRCTALNCHIYGERRIAKKVGREEVGGGGGGGAHGTFGPVPVASCGPNTCTLSQRVVRV